MIGYDKQEKKISIEKWRELSGDKDYKS